MSRFIVLQTRFRDFTTKTCYGLGLLRKQPLRESTINFLIIFTNIYHTTYIFISEKFQMLLGLMVFFIQLLRVCVVILVKQIIKNIWIHLLLNYQSLGVLSYCKQQHSGGEKRKMALGFLSRLLYLLSSTVIFRTFDYASE